jgi:nicotinamidase-related amidase
MGRALLLVDVIKDFRHEDGDKLLASYRERHQALAAAIRESREAGHAVVYANDNDGLWDSKAPRLVQQAIDRGKAGDLVAEVAQSDTFVLKRGYSGFDATPLASILREELNVDELAVAGTATEMCVFQTVTDALRIGFRVSVLANACATVDEANKRLALDYLERVVQVEIDGR